MSDKRRPLVPFDPPDANKVTDAELAALVPRRRAWPVTDRRYTFEVASDRTIVFLPRRTWWRRLVHHFRRPEDDVPAGK
ncbi:MAG: hypothetical protein ACRENL_01835 [Candidatus Dormibacteria bacterium]